MKITAVAVATTNLAKTVEFYSLIGFQFPEHSRDEQHLEPTTPDGSARLMIDTDKMLTDILGEVPRGGNHSGFAIEFAEAAEVDNVVEKISGSGFKVVKHPWDAFWGQRYAIVEDPDGYKIDLYAYL